MTRLFAPLATLLLALLAVLSCGESPPAASAGEGEARILSLSPHATQMLEAFGVMDQVVGVTDFCPLPATHADVPRVGGLMNPNVELMLSLRPTLAFHAPTARNLEERLAAAGVRMVPLPNESLADIFESIEVMGRELGLPSQASEMVDAAKSELIRLSQEYEDVVSPFVLLVIGHTPGSLRDIHAVGPGTFLNELLERAGGRNIMANSPTRYPQVGREVLIQSPPEVIVMSAPVGGWTSEDRRFLEKAWRDMLGSSGEGLRVVFVEDASLTIPGPHIGRSAKTLAGMIHGQDAED